jgi:hypothetical protein
MATIADIVTYLAGPGFVFPGEDHKNIFSPEGRRVPTLAEIEAARTAVEAALGAAAAAVAKVWSGKRDFDAEFTDTETYALEITTDPTLIVLRARLNRWEGEIRAEDSRVQAGLAKMVELGILTTQRKAAIDGGL